ncbi:KCTD12 [Scenedesmus sp. PABB004]|nr:KCTD12 [Scenedesmus sp. PABB004]
MQALERRVARAGPRTAEQPAAAPAARAGAARQQVMTPSASGPCRRRARGAVAARASPGEGGGRGAPSSTLEAHRTWLRRQRVLHAEPHPSDADILELNVGGAIMVTSRSTLRQVRGSLLHLLFDPANASLLLKDASGRPFFDYDPSAMSLVLRYLRELKVSGGCSTSVLLPPIPPADAGPFRSLAQYLGLQIDEGAISSATARGAAISGGGLGASASGLHYGGAAAAGAAPSGGGHRPSPASPYASRPAAGAGGASQWASTQQQLTRPRQPAGGASSCGGQRPRAPAKHYAPSRPGAAGHPPPPPGAARAPRGAAPPAPPPPASGGEPAQSAYYYLRTSPPLPAGLGAAGLVAPLRVSVLTEADVAAAAGSSSGAAAGAAAGSGGGAEPFDLFVSASAGRQLLVLSVVTRPSAGLSGAFLGVTSANHLDQVGTQIPCFGWRQAPAPGAPGGGAPLWRDGDLVQLLVELGGTSRLCLKVNGAEVPGAPRLELPSFRHLHWNVTLFRGTEVAAVALPGRAGGGGALSIYSGDTMLRRYLP